MKIWFDRHRLLHLAILLLIAGALQAQNIRFSFTGGNTESFPVNAVSKITFSGSLLNLHLNDGATESWEVSTIRNYSFEYITGLPESSLPVAILDVQLFPNPTSGAVTISYTLPTRGAVKLEISDQQGKPVKLIFNSVQGAGNQTHQWNGKHENAKPATPGLYICKLSFNGQTVTKNIIIQ